MKNPFPKSPFRIFKLIDRLRDETDQDTILGMAIVKSIYDGKPYFEIIKWIKDQGKDCPDTMISCIGLELWKEIDNFIN